MKHDDEFERLVVQPLREELAALPALPMAERPMSLGALVAEYESHQLRGEREEERLEALAYTYLNI
jgi:hypothetical protein